MGEAKVGEFRKPKGSWSRMRPKMQKNTPSSPHPLAIVALDSAPALDTTSL